MGAIINSNTIIIIVSLASVSRQGITRSTAVRVHRPASPTVKSSPSCTPHSVVTHRTAKPRRLRTSTLKSHRPPCEERQGAENVTRTHSKVRTHSKHTLLWALATRPLRATPLGGSRGAAGSCRWFSREASGELLTAGEVGLRGPALKGGAEGLGWGGSPLGSRALNPHPRPQIMSFMDCFLHLLVVRRDVAITQKQKSQIGNVPDA